MKIASGTRILALVVALAGVSAPVTAQVANFESKPAFSCDNAPSQTDGGLTFSHNFFACFYSPTDPADWPFTPSSTVMGIGFSPITMTRADNSAFSFLSADLSAGVFSTPGSILVTGFLNGGGTVTQNIDLIYGFQTYNFNWSNLSSVEFSELPSTGYIGFDNVAYGPANVVPEPATFALMVPGLLLTGLGARRFRRRVG